MSDHRRPVAAGWSSPRRSARRRCRPGSEPVRMSCRFGSSPRPLTTAPDSSRAVSLSMAFASPCSASTLAAISTPSALTQGPGPDPVAGVLGARREIGAPCLAADPGRLGEACAMGVGSFDAAEIRALTRIGAGDEKAHRGVLRRGRAGEAGHCGEGEACELFHDGPPGSMPIAVTIARPGGRPSGKVRRSRRRRVGDRRVDPDPHEE